MPPIWATLDASQCVRAGFDESTGKFRTDATATIVAGDITVEIDGIYTPLNPDPDNIGLIGHTRAVTPTALDQVIRLTAVDNASVHALDIALHLSDGSAVDALNPLPITFPGSVSVTQGTSPWVVSGTVAATQSGTWNINNITGTVSLPTGAATSALQTTGNTSLSSIDGKLNSLGQKLMAGSVPVVIASDQSAITVTGSVTTSPNVNIHDSAGGNLTSTGTSLNTNITNTSLPVTQATSPWNVSGTVTANQGTSALPGDAWYMRITDGSTTVGIDTFSLMTRITNTAGAGAVNIQDGGNSITVDGTVGISGTVAVTQSTSPWVVSGTVTANQGTSPWVVSGTTTAAEDKNYGTVGANTLRTAAQIGNATGAALFGAGTTTAQVLRVVLPTDQSAIPVTQSGTWTTGRTWTLASGTDSVAAVQSGTWTVQPGNTANTTAWLVTGTGGTFPATQSGTWNINNISGTISLPTGAATEASLAKLTLAQASTTSGQSGSLTFGAVTTAAPSYTTATSNSLSLTTAGALRVDGSGSTQPVSGTVTANQGTSPWVVAGAAASGASKSGNPVQIGGVFNTTQPTVTSGQAVEAQSTARGALIVATGTDAFTVKAQLQDNAGTAITLGQKVGASSLPMVQANEQTYSTSITGLATAATATDIFTITGSGTKTVKVKKIRVTANRTTSTTTDLLLIKRSTANTGGTSTTQTAGPHDSNNNAATATVLAYTANPTTGTAVATLRVQKQFINVAASGTSDTVDWFFGENTSQPVVLRGTSQVLAINLNSVTVTSPSFNIYIEWTEEA